jgi:hypothetical protein
VQSCWNAQKACTSLNGADPRVVNGWVGGGAVTSSAPPSRLGQPDAPRNSSGPTKLALEVRPSSRRPEGVNAEEGCPLGLVKLASPTSCSTAGRLPSSPLESRPVVTMAQQVPAARLAPGSRPTHESTLNHQDSSRHLIRSIAFAKVSTAPSRAAVCGGYTSAQFSRTRAT